MFAPEPVVYFFSDFGSHGPYTGQVEAVIRNGAKVQFIDLLSNSPVADPFHSAYLLAAIYEELPVKNGYLLAVVDPGVGSGRKVISFEIGKMTFLGPDNGLFSRLIHRHGVKKVAVLKYPSKNISNSFHARDWFAPELVRMINGETIDSEFVHSSGLIGMEWPELLEEVIYIDHYGNLVTGIPGAAIQKSGCLIAGNQKICNARTFSEVPNGALLWYENSMGMVEIAANTDSAAVLTGMEIGHKVYFSPVGD